MRVPKRKQDFGTISRQSIKQDFRQRQADQPKKEPEKQAQINQEYRIAHIHENCEYARFARYFVSKLMRCVESRGAGTTTGWYEFVYDADRTAVNKAAGWSDAKTRYLLERPKFKNQ